MAAPRPLRWVLTARDQTRAAFGAITRNARRAGQAITRIARAATFVRVGLGGMAQRLADVAGRGAEIDRVAIGFNSTAKEVDGLMQAFEQAGRTPDDMQSILAQLQVMGALARSGDEQARSLFDQFQLNPDQRNDVRTLINLIENVRRQGAGAREDFLGQLIGTDAIRTIRLLQGALPNVAAFVATADTVTGGEARRANVAAREQAGALRRVSLTFQRGIDQLLPFINFANRAVQGRVGEARQEFRGELDRTVFGILPGLVSTIQSIEANTRDANRLGR